MNENPTPENSSRNIRVFISSTFRDMFAEREELVKFTFPELRRRCRERQVEFTDVDLRWGITEEQKAEGQVLPICLAEIEHCRPYFVGVLGERYGWVPEEIDQALITEKPWLKEHRQKSVTELEIIHGVLRDHKMKRLAYFYFRNAQKSAEVEKELQKQPGYTAEPKASKNKLASLKRRIEKSGFALHKDYPDAKTFGQMVLDDLWTAIDQRFPAEEVPSALERERLDHEAFAEARRKVYIGREAYFKQLDVHIAGEGPPLVILGESGSGKSALLANWSKGYRESHPEDFMVLHFTGSTPYSADYSAILRRIIEEIREWTAEGKAREEPAILSLAGQEGEDKIPTDRRKLIEQFPVWLARAAAKGKMILILDGLNQLEDRDNAPDLGWLPLYFPANIRVIVSTLPGRSGEALEKRDWQHMQVHPLTATERQTFIHRYLLQYRKELGAELEGRIARAAQSANPLYLKALLEELRVYGEHETLQERVNYYLKTATPVELYKKILERYEQDYEQERPGLVKEALSLLWAARRGLSETELLELLGRNGQPLLQAHWSPLYLALEESLVSRSGLFTFFHDFIRQAVEESYLDSKDRQEEAHLGLADYFENLDLNDRKADELPWQLQESESWDRLKDCLTDLPFFVRLMAESKRYELMNYWRYLEDRYDMVETYTHALTAYQAGAPNPQEEAYFYDRVAFFLEMNARYEGAEPLYRRALAIREQALGAGHPDTARSLNNLALLLKSKGDYEEAEPLQLRALAIYEQMLGTNHPDTALSLNNLAELLRTKRDYEGAEPLQRRALAIREQVLGESHPHTASSLNNLALLLHNKGDYEGAESLYRRALAIYEQVLGDSHPYTASSLNNLAGLLDNMDDYEGAEPLYRRALAIFYQVLGANHPDTALSLNNLAELLRSKGDYEGAEPLLGKKGDYEGAEPLYRRALAIREQVLGASHPDTAQSLNNLAGLLKSNGDYEGAEKLYRRAIAIYEQVMGVSHPDTANSLNNLALLLKEKGDYEGAEPLYRRALTVREQVLGENHPDTAQSLNNLAGLLGKKGDYEGAEPLQRRALAIYEQVLGANYPDTRIVRQNLESLLQAISDLPDVSLEDQARELETKGNYEKAALLYRQALKAHENSLGAYHPEVALTLNTLAILLRKMGRPEDAEPLLRRAIGIEGQALPPDSPKHPHRLNNLCTVLVMQAKTAEAKIFSSQAWHLKSGKHDITSIRILFVRLTIALLESEPVDLYVGQLKTLLTGTAPEGAGNVSTTWNIGSFLVSLLRGLSSQEVAFLESLNAALNDRTKVPDLDRFPLWFDQPAISLEAEWPGG